MSLPIKALGLGIMLAAAGAAPASAAARPKTRLVSCLAGNCLLVTGHRADTASTVTINGHTVATHGARRWRTSLPLETVRTWSAPHARTITISVIDRKTHEIASTEADLPIGLLGHAEMIAMLVVNAK
jgi:hypothetical protein